MRRADESQLIPLPWPAKIAMNEIRAQLAGYLTQKTRLAWSTLSALGVRQGSPSSARVSSNAQHPQKRQFARDGDVRVELLQSHDNNHVNQLDAIREALQSQIAAREEVERLLAEARHTIHDLQTAMSASPEMRRLNRPRPRSGRLN
jgi:hypothetical protein